MNRRNRALFLVLAAGILPTAVAAFPLNLKKAPESQDDLVMIHDAVQKALPRAKGATVCIDLGEGSGSGVIISEDGLVMTAAHVSTGVGKKLTVIMPDGKKLKAKSLGLRADTDAALVQITEEGKYPFVEVNEVAPKLGDWVFSLGHSGGFDEKRGAVLRLARLVRMAQNTFQSDGTLIGGDSGGPLFDMDGRLIGIHSRVGAQLGVNMHVPMSVFLESMDQMKASEFIGEGPFAEQMEKGTGFVGIATEAADGGLRITKVGKNTPAEKAGFKVGDLIVKVDDKTFAERKDFQEMMKEMRTGDEMVFEILRDGIEKKITLELGSR